MHLSGAFFYSEFRRTSYRMAGLKSCTGATAAEGNGDAWYRPGRVANRQFRASIYVQCLFRFQDVVLLGDQYQRKVIVKMPPANLNPKHVMKKEASLPSLAPDDGLNDQRIMGSATSSRFLLPARISTMARENSRAVPGPRLFTHHPISTCQEEGRGEGDGGTHLVTRLSEITTRSSE